MENDLELHNLPLNVKMYPTTVLLYGRVCISDTFTYPVDTTVTFGLSCEVSKLSIDSNF